MLSGRKPSAAWFLSLLFVVVALPALANSGNRIHQVRLTQESGLTVVEITGERALNFTTFKQDAPKRVVVDMAECSLTGVPKKIAGDGQLVETISTTEIAGAPHNVSRVVIGLSREAEYRVTARGGSLFIYLSPGTGGLLVSAGIPMAPEREQEEPVASLASSKTSKSTNLSLTIGEEEKPIRVAMVTPKDQTTQVEKPIESTREPKLVPLMAPKPVSVPEPKPIPVVETKPAPAPIPEPKPLPVVEPKPVPVPEPKPVLFAQLTPAPKPTPVAEQKVVVAPEQKTVPIIQQKSEVASVIPPQQAIDHKVVPAKNQEKVRDRTPIENPAKSSSSPISKSTQDETQPTDMDEGAPSQPLTHEERVEEVPPPPAQKTKTNEAAYQPRAKEFVSRFGISRSTKKMTWVGFQQTQDSSQVFVKTSEPVRYRITEESDHLVVLELENTRITKRNDRRFLDTHFFNTAVTMVTPREVAGPGRNVRVEIQLKDRVSYTTGQESNVVFIRFQLPK
jgi:hypothetical protein